MQRGLLPRAASATARRLVDASVSANTCRAYAGALGQLDAWLDGRKLDDAALAAYLVRNPLRDPTNDLQMVSGCAPHLG